MAAGVTSPPLCERVPIFSVFADDPIPNLFRFRFVCILLARRPRSFWEAHSVQRRVPFVLVAYWNTQSFGILAAREAHVLRTRLQFFFQDERILMVVWHWNDLFCRCGLLVWYVIKKKSSCEPRHASVAAAAAASSSYSWES